MNNITPIISSLIASKNILLFAFNCNDHLKRVIFLQVPTNIYIYRNMFFLNKIGVSIEK